jgi:hypothetical protein
LVTKIINYKELKAVGPSEKSRDISVGTEIRLLTERPQNNGSIPEKDKRVKSSPDWL